MVALVVREGVGAVAVHRTYLLADGSGKADVAPDKASLGPVGGGAVRFGVPRYGEWLAVAEGIETTLSVIQVCGLAGWAALSEGGVRGFFCRPRQCTFLFAPIMTRAELAKGPPAMSLCGGWPRVGGFASQYRQYRRQTSTTS